MGRLRQGLLVVLVTLLAFLTARFFLPASCRASSASDGPGQPPGPEEASSSRVIAGAQETRPASETKRSDWVGYVRDEHGSPVSGAVVILITPDAGMHATFDMEDSDYSITDASGAFPFASAQSPGTMVVVVKDGYSMQIVDAARGNLVVLTAARPARIKVHDGSGNGIGGVKLKLTAAVGPTMRLALPETVTADDGTAATAVSYLDAAAAALDITVDAARHEFVDAVGVSLRSCASSPDGDRLIRLWEARPLEVRVHSGLPPEGTLLALYFPDSRTKLRAAIEPSGRGLVPRAPKGADSVLVFAVSPGLEAYAAESATNDAYYPHRAMVIQDVPRHIDVLMSGRSGRISGRLVPFSGQVSVVGRLASGVAAGVEDSHVTANVREDGSFILGGLRFGVWDVNLSGLDVPMANAEDVLREYPAPSPFARLAGQAVAQQRIIATDPGPGLQVRLDADQPEVSINWRLAGPGAIRGTVTDESGGPIAGAVIVPTGSIRQPSARMPGVMSDVRGVYVLDKIPSGTYRLTFDHAAYRRSYSGPLKVSANQEVVFNVAMSRGVPIQIVMVDENDIGLVDLAVEVHEIVSPRGFVVENAVERQVTGKGGVATFAKLGVGSYVVKFPAGVPGDRSCEGKAEIEFAVSEATNRFVFKLTPTFRIRGFLRDELGYAPRQALLWVTGPDSPKEIGGKVGDDGYFELSVPSRGTYSIGRLLVPPQAHEAGGITPKAEIVTGRDVSTDAPAGTHIYRRVPR